MAKVKVSALAEKMGLANQDLLFKLKSIGVRLEGDDPEIDMEIMKAILTGKKMQQPREVILRDQDTPEPPARKPPMRRPPPGGPLRGRRRPMIQRVESRIKTIPSREAERRKAEAAKEKEKAAAAAQESAAEAQSAPAPEAEAAAQAAQPAAKAPTEAARRKPAAASPGPSPGRRAIKSPSTGRPPNIQRPAGAQRPAGQRRDDDRRRAARPSPPGRRDYRAYRGPARNVEITEEELERIELEPVSARGQRRAKRRENDPEAESTSLGTTQGSPVTLTEGMTVRDFAEKLGMKTKELMAILFERGIIATINQTIDEQLAEQIAEELGMETMVVTFEEEVQLQEEMEQEEDATGKEPRAPVVTVMGHVDHGKTSLLDAIRQTSVTDSEHGGITQHIAAYQVDAGGKKVVFLDTPGHEAFTKLRARGAQVTDLVVLVVAADDGVMAQTKEAIDHAKAAGVPIIVAINKIDKENANVDRVKKELADNGLMVEDWGGDIVSAEVSALRKQGIDELLELIHLAAEMLELKADPAVAAQGAVIEARKETGRGIVATVLIQAGTLEIGDVFVAGSASGKVRSMMDDRGKRVKKAGPATPIEVTGFSDLPAAGDTFQAVDDEAKARSIAQLRQEEARRKDLSPNRGAVTLDQLFDQIEAGAVAELPVVIKADVQGSLEVLKDTLLDLSTDKVKVNVIHGGVGAISTNDVLLAAASDALVYGFNVRGEKNAVELASTEGVEIRTHTVIYELHDELRKAMTGLLKPTFKEVDRGRAEVRELFKVPKVGTIAGCHVVEGKIHRNDKVRLLRDNVVVFEGKISSLRRFKDDASEVRSGFDCGIGLERYQDVKPGDFIEAYVREEVEATL